MREGGLQVIERAEGNKVVSGVIGHGADARRPPARMKMGQVPDRQGGRNNGRR